MSSEKPDVVALIVAMFQTDPTLSGKQLSARLNLSVSRLARLFKRRTGVSIVEFRNRLRFERFFTLIAVESTRRLTLRSAARDAGFGSYPHFHRLFRARLGLAPRAALQNQATVLHTATGGLDRFQIDAIDRA